MENTESGKTFINLLQAGLDSLDDIGLTSLAHKKNAAIKSCD